jgi:hypothetical protein
MTSGFSTIAGSVLSAYIALGVPAQNLVTSSVMSIPASIAISKIRVPETEEPVTRGQVVVDRGENPAKAPVSWLYPRALWLTQWFSARQMRCMRSVREHFLVSLSPAKFCRQLLPSIIPISSCITSSANVLTVLSLVAM